jgi:hypothetical protein
MLFNSSKIRSGKIDDPVAHHVCQIDHSVDNFGTAKSFGIHKAALIYKIIVNALLESK